MADNEIGDDVGDVGDVGDDVGDDVVDDEFGDDFDHMGLNENIIRGIYGYGFEKPSVIQSRAIIPIIQRHDIIAQAQSGTGKTGAFVLGSLQNINIADYTCQVIVIAPTRELAFQIKNVYDSLGAYTNTKTAICVGGINVRSNIAQLKGSHIAIGTPGRLIDLIERRSLSTKNISMLILDEADEMLSVGFQDQIKKIILAIPKESQVCLFSATMPNDVIQLTKQFMNKPKQILIKREMLTLEGISQFYVFLDQEAWKVDTLCDLYSAITVGQSIIYVNTKKRADWLSKRLGDDNFTTAVIHSEMDSNERGRVLREFRKGDSRVLISTDLLSRGIDIQSVSVVINYDLPRDLESYLHRIGRSGRYGRKGIAINFVTPDDSQKMVQIEQFYETQIEALPVNIEKLING